MFTRESYVMCWNDSVKMFSNFVPQRQMTTDIYLVIILAEEQQQVRKAILSCSLTRKNEKFEGDPESEDGEDEWGLAAASFFSGRDAFCYYLISEETFFMFTFILYLCSILCFYVSILKHYFWTCNCCDLLCQNSTYYCTNFSNNTNMNTLNLKLALKAWAPNVSLVQVN